MDIIVHAAISSSGTRKYTYVWRKLKLEGKCNVSTTHKDYSTVIEGVKKEKTRDKNKPKNKRLQIASEEIPNKESGQPSIILITFKLVDEVSINTI